MKTKILVGIMFLGLLFPFIAKADVPPELEPLCWRKLDCDAARAVFGASPGNGGWFQEAPCTGEWGKCLPSGKTTTEIAFGGKKEFNNIGEFLKTNYNLALTIAGILAVIMIIAAGVQWVTSGGNSEMITGAKKRIGGALTGLLIAYLSYTILNTVNPALINLRLPQNFLLRPSVFVTNNLCINLEEPMKVAPIKEKTDSPAADTYIDSFKDIAKLDEFWTSASDYEILNPLRETDTKCGQLYLVKDGGGTTCNGSKCGIGEICDKNKVCQKFSASGEVNGIKGNISYKDEKFVDYLWLYAICKGSDNEEFKDAGSIVEVASFDGDSDSTSYNFTNIKLDSFCGGYDNIEGFFFKVELNDSDKAPAIDDWWFGGLSMCKNVTNGPSCGIIGKNSLNDADANIASISMGMNNQLIRRSYIKNGFLCDLDINKLSMPNVGNGVIASTVVGMSDAAKKGMELLANSGIDLLGKEAYVAGVNYNCPYFTNEAAKFKTNLLKVKCKFHPEKPECTK